VILLLEGLLALLAGMLYLAAYVALGVLALMAWGVLAITLVGKAIEHAHEPRAVPRVRPRARR
jgi:hypothetical protein